MDSAEKIKIKNYLQNKGFWDEFVSQREALKKEGYKPHDAWVEALRVVESHHGILTNKENPDVVPNLKDSPGGMPDFVKVIGWIFEALGCENVLPETAPSPGTWAYYQRCKRSPTARESFYTQFWKLCPSKTQLDEGMQFADDGRKVIDLIERIERVSDEAKMSVLPSSPEGEGSES